MINFIKSRFMVPDPDIPEKAKGVIGEEHTKEHTD